MTSCIKLKTIYDESAVSSRDSYPMLDATTIEPRSTSSILNEPSSSVAEPKSVPSTVTFAPARGFPDSSRTLPDKVITPEKKYHPRSHLGQG